MRLPQFSILLAIVVAMGANAGDVLNQIEAKLKETWSASKTLKCIQIHDEDQSTERIGVKISMTSTTEFSTVDGVMKYRLESKTTEMTGMKGSEKPSGFTELVVHNGVFVIRIKDVDRKKTAMKFKQVVHDNTPTSEYIFRLKQGGITYKAEPDGEVDGVPCWVLIVKIPGLDATTHCYFSKKDGVLRLSETKTPAGVILDRVTISNVEFGKVIPPERFVHVVPVGIEVEDRMNIKGE